MKKTQIQHALILLFAATIWGVAFVAQSVAADYVETFTLNGIRCLMGGIVLIPVFAYFNKKEKADSSASKPLFSKDALIGGLICGLCLFAGTCLQQYGIQYTSVGKAGFITALYIVLVPVTGIFFRKKVGLLTWVSIVLALFGLYLLCIKEDFTITKGDFYILLCAFAFTGHILAIDHFVQKVSGVLLSMLQFFVCGVICTVLMFVFEQPDMSMIWAARIPILYAGVMSCGVAYTLQIVGQKGLNPTVASLILSLESVISALAGWVILGENLTLKEIIGCAIMFAAISLTCVPSRKRS